jgi:hypothetical protein
MDHYLAEIELIEWWRKARERAERASMLARAPKEEAETEMLKQSQTPARARSRCRCWHCAATSPGS